MNTPIYDFVQQYHKKKGVRFHMPGHKGKGPLGVEHLDVTEIVGADELYRPSGIILQSENNATKLFQTAHTFYSTEGSSLSIKSMLALCKSTSSSSLILAGRNAHKSFVYGCALLGIDVEWLYGEKGHICTLQITPSEVEKALQKMSIKPMAVFVTSPDYLGNLLDIQGIAQVCDRYGVPLLVDNAHGSYLSFLKENQHPIFLGASMCCDSAHKTLPVLTGGGYLHVAKKGKKEWVERGREYLSLFASTSPSYLILQSLDVCNARLSDGFSDELADTVKEIERVKKRLKEGGYSLLEGEPLKITIDAFSYGYLGEEIAEFLRENRVEVEFFDRQYVVCMCSPNNEKEDYEILVKNLLSLPKKDNIQEEGIFPCRGEKVLSIKDAIFSDKERIKTADAERRICGECTVSCPPAIPIAICGERITKEQISVLRELGFDEIEVVKE